MLLVQIVSIDLALANGTLVHITPESSPHFWKAAQVCICSYTLCAPHMCHLSIAGRMGCLSPGLRISGTDVRIRTFRTPQLSADGAARHPAGNPDTQSMMCCSRGLRPADCYHVAFQAGAADAALF